MSYRFNLYIGSKKNNLQFLDSVKMDRWKNQVVIVTGASAGIGAAIVENLLNYDLKVVGLSRRKEILDQMSEKYKEKQFYGIKTDMKIEEDILNTFKWVTENLGPVSILINNAGILRPTPIINAESKDFKDIFDTNVIGLTIATREAIQSMRSNGIDGHVIHINSITGHYLPHFGTSLNIYPASKHAVTAITELLRQELNAIESKIKITSVSPGIVDTDIFAANGLTGGEDKPATKLLAKFPKLNSKDVADAVTYILGTPPHVQITELIIRPVGESF